MDVGTGLALLGGAKVSGDMVAKMLGPTADYIGEGLQGWTERRTHNVQRVFAHAADRLGDEGLDAPGGVPPRVLKAILEEAQFADDEVIADYLGGVLASSRSGMSRDDRGASLAALVGRLSTYQVRTHYVLYAAARELLQGSALKLGYERDQKAGTSYLPLATWDRCLDFSAEELVEKPSILSHSLIGLQRENLLSPRISWGGAEDLKRNIGDRGFSERGLVYTVSALGIELFCVVHGVRAHPYGAFVNPDLAMPTVIELDLSPGARLLSSMPVVSAVDEQIG